jgi:hypothetical protein
VARTGEIQNRQAPESDARLIRHEESGIIGPAVGHLVASARQVRTGRGGVTDKAKKTAHRGSIDARGKTMQCGRKQKKLPTPFTTGEDRSASWKMRSPLSDDTVSA